MKIAESVGQIVEEYPGWNQFLGNKVYYFQRNGLLIISWNICS